MAQVRITVTTLDGEVLEMFTIADEAKDSFMLASEVVELVSNKFEIEGEM